MKKLRLALIGLGNNMMGHIRRLEEMPEVEIVAGVDPAEAAHARTRERYPQLTAMPIFADHNEMLRTVQPDAVEISTPHAFHCRQIVDSLQAGAHVLVEKPMVNSVAEAQEVLQARDAAGKIVLVSYQRHYQPAFRLIKHQVESGTLGEIQFIAALQNQQWYAAKFRTPELPWRVKPELSGGGQLNDSASHLIDILLYVTSLEPRRVFSFQQSFKLEVDVNSAIAVRLANGADANISIVGNAPGIGGAVWEDITFYGSKGALYYRMLGQAQFKPWLELRLIGQSEPVDLGPWPAGSTPDANFVAACLGREPVLSPAECGLRVIQLTEAAWRSADTGQPVEVEQQAASAARTR